LFGLLLFCSFCQLSNFKLTQPKIDFLTVDFDVARREAESAGEQRSLGSTAPEITLGSNPTEKSDCYSLAMVYWEILTGFFLDLFLVLSLPFFFAFFLCLSLPFFSDEFYPGKTPEELLEANDSSDLEIFVKHRYRPPIPEYVPYNFAQLLEEMWLTQVSFP